MSLIFDNLSYSVEKEQRFSTCRRKDKVIVPLLEGISGVAKAGEMIALMGTSGAGKTTLLDLLACRKDSGIKTGRVLYNGEPKRVLTNVEAGYVLQADVALPNLTVEETLMYAARLRMNIPKEEMQDKVDTVMRELQIDHCAKSKVGSTMVRGISGGELRRVSIAQDLLNDPQYLFLDEPTSGLDSSSSFEVASVLSRLAKARNQIIICSIHQPSPQVFALFDKVLLISKSFTGPTPVGRMVYFGPTNQVENYFDKYLGLPLPPSMNLADHIIDMAQASSRAARGLKTNEAPVDSDQDSEVEIEVRPPQKDLNPALLQDFCKKYQESPEAQNTTKLIADAEAAAAPMVAASLDNQHKKKHHFRQPEGKYPTSLWNQFRVLAGRYWLDTLRDPVFVPSRIMPKHFVGAILCIVYERIGYASIDIQNRISVVFFILLLSFMQGNALAPVFIINRPVAARERGSKLYGAGVLLLSCLASIIPVDVINSLIFMTYVYWILNLNATAGAFFKWVLLNQLMTVFMDLYALAVGAFSSSAEMAAATLPLPFVLFMLFGGFFILVEALPVWLQWPIWLSPFYYALAAALDNEFHDVTFPCNITGNCTTYRSGNELLEFYGMKLDSDIW